MFVRRFSLHDHSLTTLMVVDLPMTEQPFIEDRMSSPLSESASNPS